MRGGLGLTQRGLRLFSRRGNGQLLFMGLVAWAAISASFVVIVLAATGSGLLGPSAAHASFVLRRRVASGGVRALFFGDEYKSSRDMARGKRIRARDAAVQTLIDEERERRRRATEDASSDGGRESRLSYFPGQYAGVIVDAARQPFSLADLREIVDFLSKIDVLNVLHLRLSDDQGFVLALDTHPELASVYWDSGAANGTMASGVYTANEMRAFVQYAKKKGVFIVPELDVLLAPLAHLQRRRKHASEARKHQAVGFQPRVARVQHGIQHPLLRRPSRRVGAGGGAARSRATPTFPPTAPALASSSRGS